MLCVCGHHLASHSPSAANRFDGPGCLTEGCACEKYVAAPSKGATITPELQAFGRALVGQHQKVILKHRQMIDDIKREFGLKE